MKNRTVFFILLSFLFCLSSQNGFAVYELEDTVPDLCWRDAQQKQICLNQYPSSVKVLIHGAPWCGPCNEEIAELVPRVSQYKSTEVIFMNLLISGESTIESPSPSVLNAWKRKYNIPFPVLASPGDPGKKFFSGQVRIPNVVVIDREGKLVHKEIGPQLDTLLAKLKDWIIVPVDEEIFGLNL